MNLGQLIGELLLQIDSPPRRLTQRHGGPPPPKRLRYHCPCGYHFPEHLGKYGCPNCNNQHTATLRLT